MKFSVIMASYNQVEFVEEAINSLLNQTYQDFELLIFDGQSTDGTTDKIKRYANHDKVFLTIEKDKGLYHARNKGILKATGDIVCFLNTDDFYEPNALQIVATEFLKQSNIDVIYGLNKVVDKQGEIVRKNEYKIFNKQDRISKYQALPDQSTFILRKHLPYVGLYDCTFRIVSDWDYWLRAMVLDLNFKALDHYIANFRSYDETLTNSPKFVKIRFLEVKRLYKKYNNRIITPFLALHYFRHLKYYLKKIKLIEAVYRPIRDKYDLKRNLNS